jgi:lysophospholipase L1-like esterase
VNDKPMEADYVWGWRNRPNLRDVRSPTDKHGIYSLTEVPFNRIGARYRLLILGDSSSVGFGLRSYKDSWPQLLEAMAANKIEVVNAATVGYSSEQALRWLRSKGDDYRPDGIAVYLGNNDSAGSSMTDRALLRQLAAMNSNWILEVDRWLIDHSAAYAVVKGGTRYVSALAHHRDIGLAQVSTSRVPLDQYRQNMEAILHWAAARRLAVYVITPPRPLEFPPYVFEYSARRRFQGLRASACLQDAARIQDLVPAVVGTEETQRRYPGFDMIKSYNTNALACFRGHEREQSARFTQIVESKHAGAVAYNNLGYLDFTQKNFAYALTLFNRAITLKPSDPVFIYNAGMAAQRLGARKDAASDFEHALELDLSIGRITTSYLSELRQLTANSPGAILVDANAAFLDSDNEHLFVDWAHPTRQGQEVIANLVLRILREHGYLGPSRPSS